MKSGTTSLYMDLCEHPSVFLADDKEPHSLCDDRVLTEEGKNHYSAIYARAKPGQICIDASTGYTKRPDYEGVAQRAVKLLPPDFKVIYIVRQPIERIISQHHHEFSRQEVGADINQVVRAERRYVDYSRYAYQLEPWIKAIGRERIEIVRFEDYTAARSLVLERLYGFLGLADKPRAGNEGKVYNKSQGKPVLNGFWSTIKGNQFYRSYLRSLIPVKLRLVLLKKLLPQAPNPPLPPSAETLAWLKEQLRDDLRALEHDMQRNEPIWEDIALIS